MINFNYQTDFKLSQEIQYAEWLKTVIENHNCDLGDIEFIFCSDDELLKMNQEYLQHNYFTDIITFDYREGDLISGDIFISVDRVKDNAVSYKVSFTDELKRVLVHGVLHILGYGDKTDEEVKVMREKEDLYTKMFHVEP